MSTQSVPNWARIKKNPSGTPQNNAQEIHTALRSGKQSFFAGVRSKNLIKHLQEQNAATDRAVLWYLITRTLLFVISFGLSVVCAKGDEPLAINGVENLGILRVDQTVFAGSHNSGAGYRGDLRSWSNDTCFEGLYRNQTLTIAQQLDAGVRYLDLDTMWVPKRDAKDDWWGATEKGSAWTGHGVAYAGPVKDVMNDVRVWMDEHPHEFVIVHFNWDVRSIHIDHLRGDYQLIAHSIAETLNEDFDNSHVGFSIKKHDQWPTLGAAVSANERLTIFMDKKLHQHLDAKTQGKINQPQIKDCYSTGLVIVEENAKSRLFVNATNCDDDAEFVRMSLFGGYGLEIGKMAELYNRHILEATELAVRNRAKHQKVANFIFADRIGSGGEGSGKNNLFTIVRDLNRQSVQQQIAADKK